MKLNESDERPSDRTAVVRRPYSTPKLAVLGSVSKLTLGYSGPGTDGSSSRSSKHPN